jgi:drug/metabolite transporter (DMT)-like permease
MKTALAFCLIAAVGYGVGAVLQALGARHASDAGKHGVAAMVRQPMFLLGLLADLASWVISRFALHTLPLFAVQTILAGSLAITVLLANVVLGTQLRRPDQFAIAATMLGLVIVGVSAGEDEARGISHLLKVCILLGIPATIIVGVILLKMSKSVMLAILAGGAFTGSALAARAVHIRDESVSGILSEPLLWAVLVYAVLALGLHAVALMRGSVGPVTAAMWATEVLVATVIGALALGDHMRDGWQIPASLGIAMTLTATVILARSPAQELDHRAVLPGVDLAGTTLTDPVTHRQQRD